MSFGERKVVRSGRIVKAPEKADVELEQLLRLLGGLMMKYKATELRPVINGVKKAIAYRRKK